MQFRVHGDGLAAGVNGARVPGIAPSGTGGQIDLLLTAALLFDNPFEQPGMELFTTPLTAPGKLIYVTYEKLLRVPGAKIFVIETLCVGLAVLALVRRNGEVNDEMPPPASALTTMVRVVWVAFLVWEVYGIVGFDVPLAPELSIYYDIDKVSGPYIEGAVSHSLTLGKSNTLDLGGAVGVSLGQGFNPDDESFNFDDNGVTHLDFSAGVPLTAGVFSITPVLHFQVSVDEATKFHSPSSDGSDVKLWGGVSIGWSNAAEEAEE